MLYKIAYDFGQDPTLGNMLPYDFVNRTLQNQIYKIGQDLIRI